jgi:hypothetical protein
MKITTGTNCFPSFSHAFNHYRPYLGNPVFTGGDLNPRKEKRAKDRETMDLINEKIKNKEIIIGDPILMPNQEKKLIDNRWHICE